MTKGIFAPTANQGLAFRTRQRPQPRRAPVFWTDERVAELTERLGNGETLDSIAKLWGVSRGTVIGKWNRLLTRDLIWFGPEDETRLCDLIADDASFAMVAEKLDISVGGAMAAFAVIRRQIGEQAR